MIGLEWNRAFDASVTSSGRGIAIGVRDENDVVLARRLARALAGELGLSILNKTRVAAAVGELARNVYAHGGGGRVEVELVEDGGRRGIRCLFLDDGRGIADPAVLDASARAAGAYGKGQGLRGAKRLVDEFSLESGPGRGTRIEIVKWADADRPAARAAGSRERAESWG
jgi:serine/threonine-protein kinase RsbT